jgi:hypothetical protein
VVVLFLFLLNIFKFPISQKILDRPIMLHFFLFSYWKMPFPGIEFTWMLLTAVACVLLYVYLTWTHSYWRRRGVPYLEAKIFVGSIKDNIVGKKSLAECYQECYR